MGRFGPVRRVALANVVYEDRWGQSHRDLYLTGSGIRRLPEVINPGTCSSLAGNRVPIFALSRIALAGLWRLRIR
jgi:hypothetical protein